MPSSTPSQSILSWRWRSRKNKQSTMMNSAAAEEETHRKRLSQILRYISTMQNPNANERCSFVHTHNYDDDDVFPVADIPAPFFQGQQDGIIFTTYDFFRLTNLSSELQFSSPPFSFYAASSESSSRKRTARGGVKQNDNNDQASSPCWMRLTRLTTESPPLAGPEVLAYLERWSGDQRFGGVGVVDIQELLTKENLARAPKYGGGQHPQVIQTFLGRYKKYLKKRDFQQALEPLYNRLFEWLQADHQQDDLVWGLGHARLQTNDGILINGPLLQVRVEVELARDGSLLVRPRQHTGVTMHREILAALTTLPGAGETVARTLNLVVEELETCQLAPGEPSTYTPLLKRMAVELSSGGTFRSASSPLLRLEEAAGQMTLTDAWCLYSSPKPSAVWARDACKFVETLSNPNFELPKALWALTHGPGALEALMLKDAPKDQHVSADNLPMRLFKAAMFGSQRQVAAATKKEELLLPERPLRPLFPLPTSDSQNRIAELLLARNYPAVVCEGPPGTGKTHTIANIICAYLCQGKRVLVTSKGAPALSVLRERLPACVQDLVVDVSMSESVGMRQLQQTVERLANKVSWVSAEREIGRCQSLKQTIDELEDELKSINETLSEHSERKRVIIETTEGKELCEKSLFLIEMYPWLVKTIRPWTVLETCTFHSNLADLLVEGSDRIDLVDGYQSPPSDSLISLVASKAGAMLSYLKNITKGALATMPVLGSTLGMNAHCEDLQGQLTNITINGVPPGSKTDWQLVLRALQRDKAIDIFHREIMVPLFNREGWPTVAFYQEAETGRRRFKPEIIGTLSKAAKVKELAYELNIADEVELAVSVRLLDDRRTQITSRIQKLAVDLVDATVVAELSRSFSAEAQSALVKFAQIAGKAKFGRSSQASKMSPRQRRRRQEYLEAFEKCVRYIPCWILTSSQISDYLPPQCLFDLVIIDEASQSDVTVLPGMLRGKQWLIVGDGKQVSPTEGFVAEEHIENLKAALPKTPLEDSLLPGHSFFDLCAQAYPTGRVILREHFRCAPEIISYSNQEFYDGSLTPLRLPTSTERLKPSLIDVRVPNGRKVGKVNERECDEIVNRIQAYTSSCSTSNPRTIGVISLVGDEQSRLIRGRLLDAIGPKKYKEHDILVGDPPTFQGAERDIIFLSLVCSPGAVPTQSQLMYAQRANVALSRARDRMVLVRSIDANHIPNEQDIKFSILDFFGRAAARGEPGQGDDESRSDMTQTSPGHYAISSPFRGYAERILVQQLREKGYSIQSMGVVWHGSICVEDPASGARAAVCVECSGESRDDWSTIVLQQKSIERVGWKCLRVDALSLIHDFHTAIEALEDFLASAAVLPTPPLVPNAVIDLNGDQENESIDEPEPEPEEVRNANVVLPGGGDCGDIVVISSDEEGGEEGDEDDDSDDEDGDKKPAAVNPVIVVSASDEGLGNGEADYDYGEVVALDFLRGANPASNQMLVARRQVPPRHDPSIHVDDEDVGVLERSRTERRSKRDDKSHRNRAERPTDTMRIETVVAQANDLGFGNNGDNAGRNQQRAASKRGIQRAQADNVDYDQSSSSEGLGKPSSDDTSLSSHDDDEYMTETQSLSPESSKRRRTRLDKHSRDGRWRPSEKSEQDEEDEPMAETQSRSSKRSKRSARLDKYSRDGRWYPGRKNSEQDEDVNYEQYLGEVSLENLPSEPLPEQIGTAMSRKEQSEEVGEGNEASENDEEK